MALGQSRAMDSHSATLDAGENKCFGVREIKISVFWSQREKKGRGKKGGRGRESACFGSGILFLMLACVCLCVFVCVCVCVCVCVFARALSHHRGGGLDALRSVAIGRV